MTIVYINSRKDLHISGQFRRATSTTVRGLAAEPPDALAQKRLCSLNMRRSYFMLLKNIFLAM